jgi:hypothetical protein
MTQKRFYGTNHDQIARMKQLEESQKNSQAKERLEKVYRLDSPQQKLVWYKIRDDDPDLYKRMKKIYEEKKRKDSN